MIFDEDTVWDGKPIAYSDDDIKELDKAIVHIEIPELEAKEIKDIQLIEDAEVDEPTLKVMYQANHKDKDLDDNLEESKTQAKDKDDQWAKQQYLTPDLIMLEIFLTNSIRMPVERH